MADQKTPQGQPISQPDPSGVPKTTPSGDVNTRNPEVARERMATPPAAVTGVHEEVKKGGEVPLPEGHPRNPPGSIPRAPGEWPSGQFPPEYPTGPKPAQEADADAAKQASAAAKSTAKTVDDHGRDAGDVGSKGAAKK